MSLSSTYRKLFADLQRELIEIDRDLEREQERKQELEARRAEVVAGLKGVRSQYLREIINENYEALRRLND